MRKFKTTFFRLLILFEHFEKGNLSQDYIWYYEALKQSDILSNSINNENKYYCAFPFVYGELPILFREWERLPFGVIRYTEKEMWTEDKALQYFLGLTKKEFNHLFVPYKQVPEYGGEKLTPYSNPKHVANNIAEFLRIIFDD